MRSLQDFLSPVGWLPITHTLFHISIKHTKVSFRDILENKRESSLKDTDNIFSLGPYWFWNTLFFSLLLLAVRALIKFCFWVGDT